MPYNIRTDPNVVSKTATEELIKVFDFAGDDIVAGEFMVDLISLTFEPPGELDESDPPFRLMNGTQAQVKFVGGVPGTLYKVIVTASTSNEQVLQAAGLIFVGNP